MINRRQFVKAIGKICAGIPLVGSLPIEAKAEVPAKKLVTATEICNEALKIISEPKHAYVVEWGTDKIYLLREKQRS